jgi:protocatechuate 3,4-dioxygenase beta subunit
MLAALAAFPAAVDTAQDRTVRDGAGLSLRVVRGQVKSDDDSATLLRRARITVTGGTAGAVFTDYEGRFEVAVPARSFTLRVTKPGYAPRQIQSSIVSDEPLDIRLARGAAINGRVIDNTGAPVADERVTVRTNRPLPRDTVAVDVVTRTDDLGEFRVGSLPAGSYQVMVPQRSTQLTVLEGRTGAQAAPLQAGPTQTRDLRVIEVTAPASVVEVRTGEESSIIVSHDSRAEDFRSAASYVAEYEAEAQKSRMFMMSRLMVRGNSFLSGRVTDSNGRGIVGAIVRLNPVSPALPRMAASDQSGRYMFTGITPGSYRVAASKNGLLPGEHGQQRAGQPGTVVTLRDRQRLDDINVALRRGASVTGIITDRDGEPLEGVAVHAWRLEYRNGRPVTDAVGRVRRTDDRGRYRIHSLQTGTYYVVASDDQTPAEATESVMRAPRAYYPGTDTLPLATPVYVDVGVDAAGIDMAFSPPRTVKVSGRAMNANGDPLNRPVALVGSTRSGLPAPAAQMAVMSGWNFEFPHVPPGEYVIQALHYWGDLEDGQRPSEFSAQAISVGEQDVPNVFLNTTAGSTVAGRIVMQGGGRPTVSGNWLTVAAADPDFEPASTLPRPWKTIVNPDFTFRIAGMTGPLRFTTTQDLSPSLWMKSVDMAGINLAEQPAMFGRRDEAHSYIEVVLAGDGGEVSGRVVDGRKEPVGSYVVVAFPTARENWYSGSRYIRLARPDEQAQFRLGMLPPGEYWLVAVDALEDAAVQNPELLENLSAAGRRITLAANQRMTTDLPLRRMRR